VSTWDRRVEPDVAAYLSNTTREVVLCKSSGLACTRKSILTLTADTWVSQDVLYDVAVLCNKYRPGRSVLALLPYYYQRSHTILDMPPPNIAREVERLSRVGQLDMALLTYTRTRLQLPADMVRRVLCLHRMLGKKIGVPGM
jgi:hypothetical protein